MGVVCSHFCYFFKVIKIPKIKRRTMTRCKRSDLHNKWGCVLRKLRSSWIHSGNLGLLPKARARAGLKSTYFPSPKNEGETKK